MNLVYWPFLLYFVLVMGTVLAMLVISFFLGERHHERVTTEPYESGIKPTGSTGIRMTIKFYLVALFFVIFDVESIFIFAWAIAFRELGWAGYIEIVIFIFVLLLMLVYLWRTGALDRDGNEDKKEPVTVGAAQLSESIPDVLPMLQAVDGWQPGR